MSGRPNTVWLSPDATSFSCLCEACLHTARGAELSFLDSIRVSVVRGDVAPETDVAFARCAAGHEVVLRRTERPMALSHPDERQLQLA